MTDEIVIPEPEQDAEYQLLLSRLDEFAPPVTGRGFDFSKIRGNFQGRTAKAIVLHLSCTGWSVAEIAEAIEVPSRAVSRYLAEALCDVSMTDDVEVIRRHELMKLDSQAKACWDQFERSCQDEETVTTEKRMVDGDDEEEVEETVIKTVRRGQSGNPGYQRVLLEIAKHKDKLLGLAQPTKIEVDKTERKLVINQVVVRTREEVEAAKIAGLLK